MKISLRRRRALMVEDVTIVLGESQSYLNRITGSNVTDILLNWGILLMEVELHREGSAHSLQRSLVLNTSKHTKKKMCAMHNLPQTLPIYMCVAFLD